MSRVPASPHFFRPVGRALAAASAGLVVLAAWFPAPLETAADPARAPNPAKSAWFLLWIQEIVSYRTAAVWLPLVLAVALVALPWIPMRKTGGARWFAREQAAVWIAVLAAAAAVVTLTVVALFFRGADWRLASPF